MKRLHVHVAVDSLADSIKFYSGMFAADPAVIKPDYAKWMLDDPRVNFAISQRGAETGLNHLGMQVESDEELVEMQARLQSLQPDVEKEEGVACCYAKSDKYWVNDPSGIAWETFRTLDTIPVFGGSGKASSASQACSTDSVNPGTDNGSGCCVPAAAKRNAACC
jgi:hypothetical protein